MTRYKDFDLSKYFKGNKSLLNKVLKSKNAIFVYDIDGIIVNSPKAVYKRFMKRTGIKTHPKEHKGWDYLTVLTRNEGLSESLVNSAEDDWYKPEVLENSPRYPYIKYIVKLTKRLFGIGNNYILTSRRPHLRSATKVWMHKHLPGFPKENLLIRDGKSDIGATDFKVREINKLAKIADWVVFVDDSVHFCNEVLNMCSQNVLVVNIPLGRTQNPLKYNRLFVLGRFPGESQAMYPLWRLLKEAVKE